jgi:hypothetical protein
MDFAILYESLANSVNIPTRTLKMNFDVGTHREGHAFNEVSINEDWIHAEPQGTDEIYFNNPDFYAITGKYRNVMVYSGEAGKETMYDPTLTVKYGVVSEWPEKYGERNVTVNLSISSQFNGRLKITNYARSEKGLFGFFEEKNMAKSLKIQVTDKHGVFGMVDKKYSIAPGEKIFIPYELSFADKKSGRYYFPLRLSYLSTDGNEIVKYYVMYVDVVK